MPRGKMAILLATLLLAGCQEVLFASLPEAEANQMVAVLLQHGVNASKLADKDGTDSITVGQADFAAAVQLLRDRGYPRQSFQSMGDVFKPNGLVASPMEERARFLWALGQELSGTVAQIDGVLTARVQVVLPDNDLLNRSPTPSSASVFIRFDSRSDIAKLVPQIKMLVADSVQGLSYDKVSVILVPVAEAEFTAVSHPAAASWSAGLQGPQGIGVGMLLLLAAGGFAFRRRIADLLASTRAALDLAR